VRPRALQGFAPLDTGGGCPYVKLL